jgi:hypothetical protein
LNKTIVNTITTWRSSLKPGDVVYISFNGSCIKTTVSSRKASDIIEAYGLWFVDGICTIGSGLAYLMKNRDDFLNMILEKFGPVTLADGVTPGKGIASASCSGKTQEAVLLSDAIKNLWDVLNDTVPFCDDSDLSF